jgi:hypothetical protein
VVWITSAQDPDYKRPEMAFKEKALKQKEVFKGAFSGVGFHVFTRFSWYMVSLPITVTPGLVTRAKATVMIEAHGIEGDLSRPGACGMRVGIVDADKIQIPDDELSVSKAQAEAFARSLNWDRESEKVTPQIKAAEDDMAWSLWWVVRDGLDNEHKWVTLQSDQPPPEDGPQPDFRPKGDKVRLVLQCNADEKAAISAGHYDELIIEQDTESAAAPAEPEPEFKPSAVETTPVVPADASIADLEASMEKLAGGLITHLAGASAAERARLLEVARNLQKLAELLIRMAEG